jgi:hypothetical protein
MAQKVLKTSLDYNLRSAGNIELTSNSGGTITLNTGNGTGTTIVTGDLNVLGTTTTVDSTIVEIKDNILILNSGETGAGVTLGISGIEIDRGSLPNAQILWDENFGKFVLYEEKAPLNTLGDLYVRSVQLINGNTVNNIDNDVTLSGNSTIAVTTQFAVKTYIDNQVALYSNFIFQNDSSVTVHDTGVGSYVETILDGSIRARLDSSGSYIDQIGSYSADTNLTITANGTGEIVMSKVIRLPYQISTPTSSASNNKMYAAVPSNGGTGLYFVNTDYSDELVSKRKAILYGIIF